MEEIITTDFWEDLYAGAKNWIINELPGLIFVFIVILIALRVSSFILKKLKKTLIHRADKKNKHDLAEAEKRINTLIGILNGSISIFLWTIFIMIALNKVGVEIGPILASAGI